MLNLVPFKNIIIIVKLKKKCIITYQLQYKIDILDYYFVVVHY